MTITLNQLDVGQSATVEVVGGSGALRQHFLDMGLIPQATVTLIKRAPMGDPIEVRIRSYELTLRVAEANEIFVKNVRKGEPTKQTHPKPIEMDHPGYAEAGKNQVIKREQPLMTAETVRIALVGNQNCGKTTLFNKLTGSNQHVGNFPGVTVDRKDGRIVGHEEALVTDLPGIYSLSPYTNEEIVSREFILRDDPHVIINIVDATNLERNLGYDREVIYAAAILHDIGKSFQYEERIPHEIAGEKVASEILDTLPEGLAFSAEERRLILAAVREHRKKKDGAEPIAALFYDSDKRSRTCFSCPAEKECNWKDEEKNKEIII